MKTYKNEMCCLPKRLLKTNLSVRARFVLIYCLTFADELDNNPQSIAKAIGTTHDSIVNVLYELSDAGYFCNINGEYCFCEKPHIFSDGLYDNKLPEKKVPKKKKQFVPPTLEEVQQYIKDNNYSVDAEYFFKYYDSANWHAKNGKPVLNWKQTIISWEGRNKKQPSQSNTQEPPKYREFTDADFNEDWYK